MSGQIMLVLQNSGITITNDLLMSAGMIIKSGDFDHQREKEVVHIVSKPCISGDAQSL